MRTVEKVWSLGCALLLLWATLAIHYSNLPWGSVRTALALLFFVFGVWSLWLAPARMRWAFAAAFAVVVIWWITIQPSHDRNWLTEVAVMRDALLTDYFGCGGIGAILTIVGFSAFGKHPRNIVPIMRLRRLARQAVERVRSVDSRWQHSSELATWVSNLAPIDALVDSCVHHCSDTPPLTTKRGYGHRMRTYGG